MFCKINNIYCCCYQTCSRINETTTTNLSNKPLRNEIPFFRCGDGKKCRAPLVVELENTEGSSQYGTMKHECIIMDHVMQLACSISDFTII